MVLQWGVIRLLQECRNHSKSRLLAAVLPPIPHLDTCCGRHFEIYSGKSVSDSGVIGPEPVFGVTHWILSPCQMMMDGWIIGLSLART